MAHNQEKAFHTYLKKRDKISVGNFRLKPLDHEVSIHKAHSVFTKEMTLIPVWESNEATHQEYEEKLKYSIGRIDVNFYYRSKNYCCEIKGTNNQTQFYDALKVLGYTAYYNWENETNNKPAIMMPFEQIHIEHQIMAGKLDILLLGYKKTDSEYKVVEIGDTPVWKQKI